MRLGIPAFVFGIALGALCSLFARPPWPLADVTSQSALLATAGFAAILGVATLFAIGRNGQWDVLFRSLIPFIAILLACLPLAEHNSLLGTSTLLAGFMCFETLMWVLFGEISREFRLSPILVFGLGRGALTLGTLAGLSIAFNEALTFPSVSFGEVGTVLLILLCVIIAYALLPREHEIRRIVKPEAEANVGTIPTHQKNGEIGRAPEDEKRPLLRADTEAVAPHGGGKYKMCCELTASKYLLSRRETEVMFLLAKGHNAAFIQDRLCISKSTAKTHIGHIYRKLHIHTQQELLGLIASMQDENLP
jgi:DNA-binding CsgD family transcriptional regulator